jgi:DNA-binding Lrp family transcriptional regulator
MAKSMHRMTISPFYSGVLPYITGNMSVDAVDEALISALREDARAPAALLARRLGLARTTVQARIERLERSGIIERFTILTGEAHERGRVRAFVAVTHAPKTLASVEAQLRRLPAVRALHSVSGPYDLIVEISAAGVVELDSVIDLIGGMEGVERTMTSVVLSSRFQR